MYDISYITNIGGRTYNDDRICINGVVYTDAEGDLRSEDCLIAVFDGVGGEAFGGEAATIAAQKMSMLLEVERPEERCIRAYINSAQEAIRGRQRSDLEHRRMSTTVAGLWIVEDDFLAFNIGDSRIYRYRPPLIMQISEDHTLVAENDRVFGAAYDVPSHIITRCLGSDQFEPCIIDGSDNVGEHDIYIVCSDGLWDVITYQEMNTIVNGTKSIHDIRISLFQLAEQRIVLDNISVIVAGKVANDNE